MDKRVDKRWVRGGLEGQLEGGPEEWGPGDGAGCTLYKGS